MELLFLTFEIAFILDYVTQYTVAFNMQCYVLYIEFVCVNVLTMGKSYTLLFPLCLYLYQ